MQAETEAIWSLMTNRGAWPIAAAVYHVETMQRTTFTATTSKVTKKQR